MRDCRRVVYSPLVELFGSSIEEQNPQPNYRNDVVHQTHTAVRLVHSDRGPARTSSLWFRGRLPLGRRRLNRPAGTDGYSDRRMTFARAHLCGESLPDTVRAGETKPPAPPLLP